MVDLVNTVMALDIYKKMFLPRHNIVHNGEETGVIRKVVLR